MSLPQNVAYALPTGPAAGPVAWERDPGRAVLLIHDMQEHFVGAFAPGQEPLNTVIPNIGRIREAARAAGVPVVYTAQPGNQDPAERALLTDFWGPGLSPVGEPVVSQLAPAADDLLLTKWRYSAFAKSELQERLRAWGRDQLILTGIYANIGILTTALDAFMRDVQVFAVGDAVADFSAVEHRRALEYIAARCGKVEATTQVLSGLRKTAPVSSQN